MSLLTLMAEWIDKSRRISSGICIHIRFESGILTADPEHELTRLRAKICPLGGHGRLPAKTGPLGGHSRLLAKA
ncbi:hypothetical protein J6590_067341 [Homalodisca vitripennis]|nr:hypothetical protein J6590_067341 [Homalodisca vitripennis]